MTSTRSTKQKETSYPSLLNISIQGLDKLDECSWDDWNGILCSLLAPYKGAREIMTGEIGPMSPEYSQQLDTELQSIIHRLVSSSLLHIVRDAISKSGYLGSEVYAELMFQLHPSYVRLQKSLSQRGHMLSRQSRSDTMEAYIQRFAMFELTLKWNVRGISNYDMDKTAVFTSGLSKKYRDRAEACSKGRFFTNWKDLAFEMGYKV